MLNTGESAEATASNGDNLSENEDLEPLRCWDCNINFTSKHFLHAHLFHHIKQPQVSLSRIQHPLKITIKSRSGHSFEIINSPTGSQSSPTHSDCQDISFNLAENEEENSEAPEFEHHEIGENNHEEGEANISFSPNMTEVELNPSPSNSDNSNQEEGRTKGSEANSETSDYGSIVEQPTPPPVMSPGEYPKIRIKTTGLLKEPLTITEITDENPQGDSETNQDSSQLKWNSMEDPLKLPGSDDTNLLSLFNNNERAKDLGFTTSDSEFISLDRLDERNRNALQMYNPPTSLNQNPLSNITGLPMEALAQQVSRLQPSGNGMHQQNVLINIQQFPQPPPPQPYQPPPMYHHPHPSQPIYHQPYQPYQGANPIYYPPGPGYPQHMPPPPQPQMPQLGQPPMGQPPMGQPQMVPTSQSQQQPQPYRQVTPRQQGPRQMTPGQRMQLNQRPPMGPRQPMVRQRAPMVRPRGSGMSAVRSIRPRMPMQNGQVRANPQMVKRANEQIQVMQAKKKRFDVLTPDKDDDDCQVICMQPKNMDGGLPQIQSVQGGTAEPSESSVMHLSDSITLSVRNPQPRPQSPKKSDAKAVANILATRGITVTATPKPKDKAEGQKGTMGALANSLNLNGAVSIIPSAKNGSSKPNQESHLPTVDLTDDTASGGQQQKQASPAKPGQRPGLPFKCDLCPAQYPNALGLSKHRQNYHKTASGMCEIGVPLVNLKQPGIFQKLTSLGIFNYIPLPSPGPDGTYALPIINSRSGNAAGLGATTMLTLGPIRSIPRPQSNGPQNPAAKQVNK